MITIGTRVRTAAGEAGTFLGAAGHGLGWVHRDQDAADVLCRLRDLEQESSQ